jgi:FKBP-type peptidyl-prolyl cis-trans isomerase FklB
MKLLLTSVFASIALSAAAYAQETLPSQLKTTGDKASYGIGVNIAVDLQRAGFDMNLVLKGLQDIMAKRQPLLDEDQRREAITAFNQEQTQKLAEKNKKDGAQFAANFKTEKDVKALPGNILYQVLKNGSGKAPKSNDKVTVHYRGTLVDGRQFDSSYDRGAPTSFGVQEVIDGWTQVLQQMKVGDKWKVVIPSDLAYGETGFGPMIGPNSTLVFEIELLNVEPGVELNKEKKESERSK